MGYKLVTGVSDAPYCQLESIENFADSFKLKKGISVANEWPDDVQFQMDMGLKKQIKLPDLVENMSSVLVVSPKLRDFLIKEKVSNLEFLPVTILNHKGRVATDDYLVMNTLGVQDCIDKDKSKITWNKIVTDQITDIENLTIIESNIEKDAQIFRAKGLVDVLFVREDLANKIVADGFDTVEIWDISDYG